MNLPITVPFSMPQDFVMGLVGPELTKSDCVFIFSSQDMLLDEEGRLPNTFSCPVARTVYLGSLQGKECFAAEALEGTFPQGWKWVSFRQLHGVLSDQEYALAGRALQLLEWDRVHTFCGACATKTITRTHERCKECPSCGFLAYPKLAPAVMALVRKQDKILLARGSHFPKGMYSVLAGYLDVGETLEQCVVREVEEEVGLKVNNVRYFGSQPWPFTGSLMVGFICDWVSGEIVKDPVEIEEAGWFTKDELPMVPTEISLAHVMIKAWQK